MHGFDGHPVAFSQAPLVFPLALFDEGHVGVSLFMCLSGYIFAKLLDGKRILYRAFLWNRCLRLLPLMALSLTIQGVLVHLAGNSLMEYAKLIVKGVVLPTLPKGIWSITVESHFYIVLPALLWLSRKSRWLPLVIVAAAIGLRASLHESGVQIQPLAYWTIVGRIDQFVFGVLVFQFRESFRNRHTIAGLVLLSFTAFYWMFDRAGGFGPLVYPSKSLLWIFLPTIEGLAFSILIVWYDTSFSSAADPSRASRFIGRIGEYSYSIYLLHSYVVFQVADYVHRNVLDLSNFYVALAASAVFLMAMMPIGYLSYRYIESPILKRRVPYARPTDSPLAARQRRASVVA